MQIRSECCGCGLCENICPANAITVSEDARGFLMPKIDAQKCVNCALCQKMCNAHIQQTDTYTRKSFSGRSVDDALRLRSSSGGIFGEIAKYIIEQNGTVYGASYAPDNTVVHLRVDNIEQLNKLQGSKYVQSRTGETFKQVNEDLIAGRKVLFSGTPCQVEGLYKYLKGNPENLYTVDIICHGVTSRGVWKEYLNVLSDNGRYHISNINFRDKKTGWHRFSFSYKRNKKRISRLFVDDPFCFFFDKHYIINKACFSCDYSSNAHLADITLGDLWGIEHFSEIEDDNKGTSLVTTSSRKGEELLASIKNIKTSTIDFRKAMSFNLHEPPKQPVEYDAFWDIYNAGGIRKCISVYFYKTFPRRCKLYVKAFLTRTNLIKFFIK